MGERRAKGKPKKSGGDAGGSGPGDEHFVRRSNSIHKESVSLRKGFGRHGEKDTIVGGKIDKAVKSEYKKGDHFPESEKGQRFSDIPAHTTVIGHKDTERSFRKENLK